jgi:5-enolpyruvylshikimate-3-phosphate synthase
MLMALPLLKQDSRIHVSNLKSLPYLKMTLDTIYKFGIEDNISSLINNDENINFP